MPPFLEEPSSLTLHPEATSQMQVFVPDITLGSHKCLSNQASILLQHNGIAYTSEMHLIAMISITDRNSIQVTLILLLALICPGQAQYLDYAHLHNTPICDKLNTPRWGYTY